MGTTDCVKKVYASAGIRGVYRGFMVTTLRDTPTFGVYFSSYEWIKRWWCRNYKSQQTGMFISGGVAGVLGWLATYPLDVIKSRLQTDRLDRPKYSGIIDCTKKSYHQEGWKFFFKGLGPTLARAFIVNGTTFVGYELSLGILQKLHERKIV